MPPHNGRRAPQHDPTLVNHQRREAGLGALCVCSVLGRGICQACCLLQNRVCCAPMAKLLPETLCAATVPEPFTGSNLVTEGHRPHSKAGSYCLLGPSPYLCSDTDTQVTAEELTCTPPSCSSGDKKDGSPLTGLGLPCPGRAPSPRVTACSSCFHLAMPCCNCGAAQHSRADCQHGLQV